MVIPFEAIFIPQGYSKPSSYFIVTPQTYKNVIGFTPVTYNEYFNINNDSIDIGKQYLNQDQYFLDRVDMLSYELVYSDMFHTKQRERISQMIQTLEREARITTVNIELEVKEQYLDEEEIKKRKIEVGDKVRVRTNLLSKAYNGILYNKPLMSKYEGEITTVTDITVNKGRKFIKLQIDNERFTWGEDMLIKIIDKDSKEE
jgi:hypothetical protein